MSRAGTSRKRGAEPDIIEVIPKKHKNMRFDNSDPNLYDITLLVEDKKFYCSKIVLAKHTHFFNNLFFGPYAERDKDEIRLKEVAAEDFQSFLELVHGALDLDDNVVDGILRLANMWVAKHPLKKCLDFLMNGSKKTTREKFNLATEFNLHLLKERTVQSIDSPSMLSQIIPSDVSTLDHSTMVMLFEKSLSLNGIYRGQQPELRGYEYSDSPYSDYQMFLKLKRERERRVKSHATDVSPSLG